METSRTRMVKQWLGILLSFSFLWVCLALEKGYAKGQTLAGQPLTGQEEWVLEQVAAGKVADLLKRPGVKAPLLNRAGLPLDSDVGLPDLLDKLEITDGPALSDFQETSGKNLQIRAGFLEQLLTDGFPGLKIHYHGIDLENAIISGQLDLREAEIPHEVKLKRCIIEELNLQDSNFKKNLRILSSLIRKDAIFLGIKVAKCAYFNDCTFNQVVNFNRAQIGEEFSAMGARFGSPDQAAHQAAYFDDLKVAKDALFEKAIFHGTVNFRMAQIDGLLNMRDSTFLRQAWFDSLKVAHSIQFDGSLFEKEAHFLKLKVGNYADFKYVVFNGEAWFGGGDIGVDFRAPKASFLSPDHYASFFALKVGNEANFESAVFKGPVDFGSADFGVNLRAPGARFENKAKISARRRSPGPQGR